MFRAANPNWCTCWRTWRDSSAPPPRSGSIGAVDLQLQNPAAMVRRWRAE